MRPLSALALLTSCSDYDLHKAEDAVGPDTADFIETGMETGALLDECPSPDLSPGTVAMDEACFIEADPGGFTPTIEWASTAPGSAYTTPAIGSLTDDDGDADADSDDMPDIVVVGTAGLVTALSGDGTGVHWTRNVGGSEPGSPAIGDLDGDGFPEVVVGSTTGTFALDGRTGAVVWSGSAAGSKAVCGGLGIYDLDGDGNPEVVLGNTIYNGQTGAIRATGSHGSGTGYSGGTYAAFGVAADIDQDGDQEVVVGNALYDVNGTALWYNGLADGFVAVGNFDSDPYGEIVVATYSQGVRLQDQDGSLIWGPNSYTGSTIGPPTVADFDGDGAPEIGVAGHSTYVVIETNGTLKWSNTTMDASSGFTGSSVFDFEGDGAAEAVYADEDDVWVYDGATGDVKLRESSHSSATCSEYPAVADVDNDGHAEIIYTSSAYRGSETGVRVIGDADNSWMAGRNVWNSHSYAITNVGDDSNIPPHPATNWLSYNNFRSGDLAAAAGGAFADAIPDLDACEIECEEGRLRVVIKVGNGGVEPLPPGIPYTLYGLNAGSWNVLATGTTTVAVLPGSTSEGSPVDLRPEDVPGGVLRLVVDDNEGSSVLTECHEDNNSLEIPGLCG